MLFTIEFCFHLFDDRVNILFWKEKQYVFLNILKHIPLEEKWLEASPLWVLVDELGGDWCTFLVQFKGSSEQKEVTTTWLI